VPTAVVLVKICTLPFTSSNSLFLRVMIDKKMGLPYQAIDALVAYFHRFTASHSRLDTLPVLWHQTLLSFVQRYKEDLKPAQLQLLQEVCIRHFHHMITPEVRRELSAAQGKAAY
jgi:essential nuclear protein 1